MRAEVILFDRIISSPFSLRHNSNFGGNLNRNVNISIKMKKEHFDSTISVHALLVLLFSDLSAWYNGKYPLCLILFCLTLFFLGSTFQAFFLLTPVGANLTLISFLMQPSPQLHLRSERDLYDLRPPNCQSRVRTTTKRSLTF